MTPSATRAKNGKNKYPESSPDTLSTGTWSGKKNAFVLFFAGITDILFLVCKVRYYYQPEAPRPSLHGGLFFYLKRQRKKTLQRQNLTTWASALDRTSEGIQAGAPVAWHCIDLNWRLMHKLPTKIRYNEVWNQHLGSRPWRPERRRPRWRPPGQSAPRPRITTVFETDPFFSRTLQSETQADAWLIASDGDRCSISRNVTRFLSQYLWKYFTLRRHSFGHRPQSLRTLVLYYLIVNGIGHWRLN